MRAYLLTEEEFAPAGFSAVSIFMIFLLLILFLIAQNADKVE